MKRYLVFALVGPFVGGFLLLLTTTYQSGYWAQTNLGEVGKLFAVFFKTLQYSYLFGFLPSLMIGAIDDIWSTSGGSARSCGCSGRPVRLRAGLAHLQLARPGFGRGAVHPVWLVGFVPAVISSGSCINTSRSRSLCRRRPERDVRARRSNFRPVRAFPEGHDHVRRRHPCSA